MGKDRVQSAESCWYWRTASKIQRDQLRTGLRLHTFAKPRPSNVGKDRVQSAESCWYWRTASKIQR
ncbi:hypothetical protein, partial [Salmonella enterica]|uniref:hypothetical protein n=1 Tax=Salmonella enterica TaxID=28901 RepID=UPI002FCDC463